MPVIVDYDAGNVRSVQRACQHVGMDAEISADQRDDGGGQVDIPWCGFCRECGGHAPESGSRRSDPWILRDGKPLLGICLGLQIVLEHTEEGDKDCLGIVEGACERFDFTDRSLKGATHPGWNEVTITQDHPMLSNTRSGDEFYFVHSYYARPLREENVIGTTDYGDRTFCSVIGKDNLFATQFHLEKSGELGFETARSFQVLEHLMLSKRIIACLDVRDGKLAKSVKFVDTRILVIRFQST